VITSKEYTVFLSAAKLRGSIKTHSFISCQTTSVCALSFQSSTQALLNRIRQDCASSPHHGLLLTVTAFIAVLAAPPHGLYRRPDLVRQAVPLAPQMVDHGGGVGAADPAALAPHAAAPLDDLVRLPVDQDLDPLRRVARACC
jgi:hypothetical protein